MSSHNESFWVRRAPWVWYGLAFVVIVLDLVTKGWVDNTFVELERVQVLPVFDITLRYNPGAAFSFLADAGGWQKWFFTIISSVVSVVIAVWISRLPKEKWMEALGLSLILGGAIGNLYDRVTLGHVVDFILVYYETHEFPAFNIADCGITVGAGVLILDLFINGQNQEGDNSKS